MNAIQEFEVDSVRRTTRGNHHDQITHVGNNADRWMMSVSDAIKHIESCGDAFYVVDRDAGKRFYLGIVRRDGARAPYLRTQVQGQWRDDLLALRRCDDGCQLIA